MVFPAESTMRMASMFVAMALCESCDVATVAGWLVPARHAETITAVITEAINKPAGHHVERRASVLGRATRRRTRASNEPPRAATANCEDAPRNSSRAARARA